ncbi:MAG: nucleotide exchange factor GrpE [Elusimicrobiota bacterium]|jgi:molecular chaperone GrpE
MSDPKPEIGPELEEKLAELAILQQAVAEAKQRTAEYYDQLLRLKAEFENYRKRTEKEKADSRLWGKQDVLMPLLGLVDIFEQALAQTQSATDIKQVLTGLEILHKNFAGFLRAEGLQVLDVIGKPLDPHTAEAVERVETPPEQAGQVLAELQKGYAFQGRILRPSRVRVGVTKSAENEEPTAAAS